MSSEIFQSPSNWRNTRSLHGNGVEFFLNYLLINIGHGEEKKKSRKLDQQVSGNGGLMTLSASLLQLGNRGGRNRVGRCSLLNLVYFVL